MSEAANGKGNGKEERKGNFQSTTYRLVPSELGIGHYYGHMVNYDEVGYCCGKHEIVFFSFAKTYDLIFLFQHSTRKCKWESYDDQARFLDELKGRQVIA